MGSNVSIIYRLHHSPSFRGLEIDVKINRSTLNTLIKHEGLVSQVGV